MGVRIKQLPPEVANQIAAGEVIERPASVVKELLENAYDAGADTIQIDLAYGGLNQIIMTDNGHGITAEDLALTIQAHATSKIQDATDLYQVESMGFRGEALASIASVARLSIRSKTPEAEMAKELRARGDKIEQLSCAGNVGTRISVDDLFYNLPVRKKFLKPEKIEYLAIESLVKCFALSAPHIAIQLKHNGKLMLSLPHATDHKGRSQRMSKIFGQAFARSARYLTVERAGMRLSGWISDAEYQRSQNDRIWVYINQRMVKDKLILHAVKQAYDGLLHPGRFPACLLYFNLPVTALDVNVHPTKHEVRFEAPRLVHDFFVSQLKECLAQSTASYAKQEENLAQPKLYFKENPVQGAANPRSYVTGNGSDWFILNKRFVMLRLRDRPCLLDFQKFSAARLFEQFEKMSLPLPTRRLLVPVSHQLADGLVAKLAENRGLLEKLGMRIDIVDTNKITVQSIPVALPQLELNTLFAAVETLPDWTSTSLGRQMIFCQKSDPQQLSQEEKMDLLSELDANLTGFIESGVCREMTEAACELLFHE